MLTVGVDLAKRKSQVVVMDEEGRILFERKLPNNKTVVQRFLRGLPGEVQVGCETCSNTYWLVECVEEMGIPIQVGHALNLKLIAQSRIKTDKIDARVIADLLRIGFFPSIAIPPKEIRQVRELLRGRIHVTRTLAQAKNRLHGVLTRAGVEYEKADAMGAGAEGWIKALELPEGPKFMALTYCAMIPELSRRVQQIEKELDKQIRPMQPWASMVERLTTIPGVGRFSALLLTLELWDMQRFPTAKHLASYVGIVPSVYQTGQTLRGGPLTKQGNRYVRWILVQDAWAAIRSCRRYCGMYEHYSIRQGRSRAIVPVARQLLTDVYDIWRRQISYEELVASKQKKQESA